MNLAGGIPLVECVECLGDVAGTLGEIPLSLLVMEGWVAPVELIGSVRILTLLPLSLTAGGVTLTLGATGCFDSTFIGLKESDEYAWNIPSSFHGWASACRSK